MANVFFVLFVAVFSVALADDECPAAGDNKVDWTTATQNSYYCQTSQKGRKLDNCYVKFVKAEANKLDATVYQSVIGSDGTETDTFKMEHVADGKYCYPERNTCAVNAAVTPNGDCVAYWKCPDKPDEWNKAPGNTAYFMFMCNDKSLCKAKDAYEGDYKKIIEEFLAKHKDLEIEDIPQEECKNKFPDVYV